MLIIHRFCEGTGLRLEISCCLIYSKTLQKIAIQAKVKVWTVISGVGSWTSVLTEDRASNVG